MRNLLFGIVIVSSIALAGDPWTARETLKPKDLAANVHGPLVIQVGFDVLYRAAHVTGSQYAGPGSKAEGIELLKKAVAGQPKDREIVLYCGCCPFDRCPNIRPAFAALHDAGFTHVRVMVIPENLKTDWVDKGYPTDKRAGE